MSLDLLRCPVCREDANPSLSPGAQCPNDGAVYVYSSLIDQTVSDALLGKVLANQYAIYGRLGRGGMGAVYKGIHLGLRRQVAIKTILPDPHPGRLAEHRMRFEREARLLSEMRHQGIVAVYDYGEDCGVMYMVLEYLDGDSLYEVLRREGRLPLNRAIPIARSLLEALEEPHRRGLIHRDIKPANIMIENRGGRERVVLIDFGIAKVTEEEEGTPRTRTGVFVGTPKYMAPEQLGSGEMGPWTDFYALGVLLYRMLTGSTPFRGSRGEVVASQLRDPPPTLPAELELVPLDRVIGRAMEKKPADRYPDGCSFLEALSNAWIECTGQTDERSSTAPMATFTPDALVPESHRMTTVKRTSSIVRHPPSQTEIQDAATIDGPISETSETTRSAMSGAIELSGSRKGPRRFLDRKGGVLELILAVAAIGLAIYVAVLWVGPDRSEGDEVTQRAGGQSSQQRPPAPVEKPIVSVITGSELASQGASEKAKLPSEATRSAIPTSPRAEPTAVPAKQAKPSTKPRTGTTDVVKKKATRKIVKRQKRDKRSQRRRSRSTKERRVKLAIAEVAKLIKACKCKQARQRLGELDKLNRDPSLKESFKKQNRAILGKLEENHRLECEVFGLGCNAD